MTWDEVSLVCLLWGVKQDTYAVCNLLPSSTASPFALVPEAVLINVDNTLSTLVSQSSHGLGSVSKLVQCTRAVAIHNNIHIIQELLELFSACLTLQIEIGGMLSHVSINLEKGNIRKTRARDLQHIGTIFGQYPSDCWACDDATHFKDLDAFKYLLAAIASGWKWGWWQITWQLTDFPGGFFNIQFSLGTVSRS